MNEIAKTEILSDASSATDGGFRQAVYSAANNGNAEILAAWLRSDKPIGKAERELLARMVCGDLRRQRGKPEISPTDPEIIQAVGRYEIMLRTGILPKQIDYEKEFGRSRKTIEAWKKMIDERNDAKRR